MIAMVSMKVDDDSDQIEYKPNPYGHGLELYLNDDQCEALGITEPLRAGSVVTIKAMAKVITFTENADVDGDGDGTDFSMCLQITDMEIGKNNGTSNSEIAKALYG